MIVLVNTSNRGQPVGAQILAEIRALSADGIRTDIVPDGAEQQLGEFAANPDLQVLALIHGGDMPGTADTLVDEAVHAAKIAFENYRMAELPCPPIFELGNEPTEGRKSDYWKKHAENFGGAVARAARRIWKIGGRDVLVISGGIHNPGRECQDYLTKAVKYFPRPDEGRFAIGFHNYSPGMGDPDLPQKGFKTVDDQIKRLRDHGYPLFDTESGGHTYPQGGHSETEIATWLKRRLDLSLAWGLLGSVVFQLNDGTDPNNFESFFGLVHLEDRSLKRSGVALQEWTTEYKRTA